MANLLFILALTAIVGTVAFVDARDRAYNDAGQRMQAVAAAIAANPLVLQAAGTPNPSAALQPYAQVVMANAHADFITIMAPDRTRWTHPNPDEIGKPYIGTIDPALHGQTFTEVTAGTLGPSVRTIVPVEDSSGKVRALVAAGVTVRTVDVAVSARLTTIIAISLAMLAGGSLASWLLGRYLRSVTRGWGPEQLAQLFAYYESVLHSVREGVVLIDTGRPRGHVQRPSRGAAGTGAVRRRSRRGSRTAPCGPAPRAQPPRALRVRPDGTRRNPPDRVPDPGGEPGARRGTARE